MPSRNPLTQLRAATQYAYALGVLKNRPYAYFRMNEKSGRSILNLVTGQTIVNAYSATGVTYAQAGGFADDPSTGVLFDGASGMVTLPLVTSQVTHFSLECRIKPISASIGTAMKVGNGGVPNGYGMGLGGTSLDNTGLQLMNLLDGNSFNLSTANLTVGVWSYCVWTFTSTNTNTFYVGGSQVSQFNNGGIIIPTLGIYIGSNGGGARFANFAVSDCAFYNYGLSSTQVAAQALLSN